MKPVKLSLDKLTIPAPRPSAQVRGDNAGKKADPVRAIRISQTMYDSIYAAADIMGMTGAEFIKWTAYMSANEVHRIYREREKDVPQTPAPVQREVKPMPVMPRMQKITRL